ncbi:MAG: hypothetical protein QF718_07435 [Phycisphaerales bacterium]|jgi:Pyruvate/2-oxoacid:ferredoxin oxidoreductase gamma subunit|nr:hypothetical protein [Phycisphaerales bacterium]
MTISDNKQPIMESIWTIPSIISGLSEIDNSWDIYSPICEPFWSYISSLELCQGVPTSSRGVELALERGNPSVVFVPNRQISQAINRVQGRTIDSPLILIIEDHPVIAPQLSPRELATRAGLCVIEPCDPTEVKESSTAAVKLSICSKQAVVFVTHHGLLGGSASVEVSDKLVSSTRQTLDNLSPIRLGRQLELNRQRTLPSPGEKVSVGFITIGMTDPSLKYLISELKLLGRVPMLNLRLINPIDTVPVERLLSRCRHVLVLEPRPGEVEREIMSVAQSMRREGRDSALIWGREFLPSDPEHLPVVVPVDALHPSVVARLTQHLLHDVRPTAHVSKHLQQAGPELDVPSSYRSSIGTRAALQVIRRVSERVLETQKEVGRVVIDGVRVKDNEGIQIYVETWGENRFTEDGLNVVLDAISKDETRIFLVWRSIETGDSLSTMIETVMPSKTDDKKSVFEVTLDNTEDINAAIETACQRSGVTVIFVTDGEEPRYDLTRLASSALEVDKLGFRPQHSIVIPIEQMAQVRFSPVETWQQRNATKVMPLETSMTSKWFSENKFKIKISLRPILERVEVTRNKPPVRVVAESDIRLSPPNPLHASDTSWRVHIAGSRGNQPGVVGSVLMEAGSQMGYEIRAQCNSVYVGPGRRAWSQILFTRKQTKNSHRTLIGAIPWGEADLLLGWDREEVLRAIDPIGSLQVGSNSRTYAIINTEPLEHQSPLTDIDGNPAVIDSKTLVPSCIIKDSVLRDFASLARYRFHNERLGDLVQLGMAFQLGMIPVTVDAITVAVEKVEKDGYARSIEAFDFGRRVALDPNSVWQPIKEESQVDLGRLIRRCIRDFRIQGRRGLVLSEIARRLIRQCRQSLPELEESADGRQSMIDIVNGITRCLIWGDEDLANRFVGLICQLYVIDKPETGRELTRKAILPLAEALLIRDPIYLAKLARSPEVLRRIRSRLNVRISRGDVLSRRFLSRLRIRIWNLSLRIDMRTSDWSSILVSTLGRYVPKKWRGHKRDRAVRDSLLDAMGQAINTPNQYDNWLFRFDQLHGLALSDELHATSSDEINRIIQSQVDVPV